MLNYGYEPEIVVPEGMDAALAEEVSGLLVGGGLNGMMWTISLYHAGNVFEVIGITELWLRLPALLLKAARGTRGGLVMVTELSCVLCKRHLVCDRILPSSCRAECLRKPLKTEG